MLLPSGRCLACHFIVSPEGIMTPHQLQALLVDLHGKFELVLEDYTNLQAELQALRREAREQHELSAFLLRAVAADLAAHRADSRVHAGYRTKATGRLASRPARLKPCHSTS